MALNKKIFGIAASTAILFATTSITSAEQAANDGPEKVFDAQLIEDVGGAERINFSGKLRMLSQRIPAAACNLEAGVTTDLSSEIMVAASDEFTKIANALQHGDPSLGIKGTESRRKTLAALEELKAKWEPVRAATQLAMKEGMTASLNQQLADQNGPLLGAAKLLVSELSGQYSDPTAVVQSDAIRIDIAGRQRMLSQRISKNLCYVLSGVNVEKAKEEMGKAMSTFDVSLNALMNGMPAAGIEASPHEDVIAGLKVVHDDWMGVQEYLSTVQSGGTLDTEMRGDAFKKLNTMLVDMNKVVGMYAKHSKQNI